VTGARRGVPTISELVEAVRELLRDELAPATDGALRFNVRVAANVLAAVERELELGGAQAVAHAERLARLGAVDDAALAQSIRDGELDDRLDEAVAVLRDDAAERLAIANPRYLLPEDAA
jgi:hypothetical protein